MKRPVVVGLLGGVGSGKSSVARTFERLGALVLDADREAHRVLEEPAVVAGLEERFGPGVLDPAGGIDRGALASLVFGPGATERRRFLEGLVHPRVLARIEAALTGPEAAARGLVVLDVPLLLESGLGERCDHLVFVDASEKTRLARCATNRDWDAEEVSRRERAQTSVAEKRAQADHVLDNDGSEQDLERGVQALFDILTRP